MGAARPYVFGRNDLISFVGEVFGGTELERIAMGEGFHVEMRIGDAVVVLETGPSFPIEPTVGSIYVYVEDVDETYRRALHLGAEPIVAPEDKPYAERAAGVKDGFGNTWWIATYRGDLITLN